MTENEMPPVEPTGGASPTTVPDGAITNQFTIDGTTFELRPFRDWSLEQMEVAVGLLDDVLPIVLPLFVSNEELKNKIDIALGGTAKGFSSEAVSAATETLTGLVRDILRLIAKDRKDRILLSCLFQPVGVEFAEAKLDEWGQLLRKVKLGTVGDALLSFFSTGGAPLIATLAASRAAMTTVSTTSV